jgi:hypothetical protein
VFADSCYDLVNNRNFDCDTQAQPSRRPQESAPKPAPDRTNLRDELRRRLNEGGAAESRATPEELGKRIADAQGRMESALKNPGAPGALQRYDAAIADLKGAYSDAAIRVSPALRAGLRENERMLEAHYADLATRADWNGTPPPVSREPAPVQPGNSAEATPVLIDPGNVGIGAGGYVFVCDGPIDAAKVACREIQPDGRQCLAVMSFETQVNWRDSTTTPCMDSDLAQRSAFLRAHPEVAGAVAAAAMSYECGDIAKNYVAAAQADNGPAAAAALQALKKAGGCGLLAHVSQPAAPAESDPRFVSRGATPMLDQTVAACDQQPDACAAVVNQLRAGTSGQAVAALYSNAIEIGLEIGVMMGTAVLSAQQMNTMAARRSNMGSAAPAPIRRGGGPPNGGTVYHPRPPVPGCVIGGPGWCTAQ